MIARSLLTEENEARRILREGLVVRGEVCRKEADEKEAKRKRRRLRLAASLPPPLRLPPRRASRLVVSPINVQWSLPSRKIFGHGKKTFGGEEKGFLE
jgi:hypothetical protein